MAGHSALSISGSRSRNLPCFEDAQHLFASHLPCTPSELRRVYLRLALNYHPDKRREEDRCAATQLFQAIAAAYDELLRSIEPEAGQAQVARVKTPTAAAAELGAIEELRRLLEEKPARAKEEDELGTRPLVFAAIGGCIEAAELLLDFGADVHALTQFKWPALLYAALHNHASMVSYLLSRGAEVTAHDLVLTTWTGNPNSLALLLDGYHGDLSAVTSSPEGGQWPLLHCACEGLCVLKNTAGMHAACVHLLLGRNLSVDALEPKQGRTCLHVLVSDRRWQSRNYQESVEHMEILESLCMRGASVTSEDNAGNSAISLASGLGLLRVRELLHSYI